MSTPDAKAPTSAAVPSAKRLAFLEKMIVDGSADAFARYALAMEYRKLGRLDDAMGVFEGLKSHDPNYVPQYLMAGQMLTASGRHTEARTWLTAGAAIAQKVRDLKALGEIEDALAALP